MEEEFKTITAEEFAEILAERGYEVAHVAGGYNAYRQYLKDYGHSQGRIN